MHPNLLIIFMKAPRLGTVKTRLQPELTPEQSQLLFRAMCEDLATQFANAPDFDLQIHTWPPEAVDEMQQWLGSRQTVVPQRGADLGEKMHHAFVGAFAEGYQKAAIIGSDLPTLTHSHILETFANLDDHNAVFGPTDDGGYYLIGLKTPHRMLFAGVPWSTENVLAQTLENARKNDLRIHLLRREADVDTFQEVRMLWNHLKSKASETPEKSTIPRTFAALSKIFASFS